MRRVVLVVPGRLATRTGGYLYEQRMVDGLRGSGWAVDVLELDPSFPLPTPAALDHAAHVVADMPDGTTMLVDGLAFGAMPAVLAHAAARLSIVGLIHLPLAAAVGLDAAAVLRFELSERRSLEAARLIIVTGHATLPLLGRHGLHHARIVVVEPGTAPAPLAHGSRDGRVQVLSVATLAPGKGHETLLEALASMPDGNWRLTCAGSLTRHPETAAAVRAAVRRLRLDDRVSLVGDLDALALAACYDGADVFALATERETYGMAVAEGLARGLPVVSTETGAIPDLVGDDAGLLVPPGDAAAFARALALVVGDSDLRTRLAAGARRARASLPDWEHATAKMADALSSLDAHV
jgi:glycosyltransferase involved in cell wall biosynthesis